MSNPPTIMVSSTVHKNTELLDRIYNTLTKSLGYDVWMSHKGIPVRKGFTKLESCLEAVYECDYFLGLITPEYGSGRDETGFSYTHRELRRAITLDKIRWFLVHENVVFARRFLRELGYGTPEERATLTLTDGAHSLEDLRIIDMYDEASLKYRYDEANLKYIKCPEKDEPYSWVQPYRSDEDALRHTSFQFPPVQFSRSQEIEEFLKENFKQVGVP